MMVELFTRAGKIHTVLSPPYRQEALLAAISEKDANIALLELSSSKKKKTQDEVALLKREKDRLVQQLKQQVGEGASGIHAEESAVWGILSMLGEIIYNTEFVDIFSASARNPHIIIYLRTSIMSSVSSLCFQSTMGISCSGFLGSI